MAQLLLKINQNGTDTISVEETREEVKALCETKIIFDVTVAGEIRSYNRNYVVGVLESPNMVEHNDRSQL